MAVNGVKNRAVSAGYNDATITAQRRRLHDSVTIADSGDEYVDVPPTVFATMTANALPPSSDMECVNAIFNALVSTDIHVAYLSFFVPIAKALKMIDKDEKENPDSYDDFRNLLHHDVKILFYAVPLIFISFALFVQSLTAANNFLGARFGGSSYDPQLSFRTQLSLWTPPGFVKAWTAVEDHCGHPGGGLRNWVQKKMPKREVATEAVQTETVPVRSRSFDLYLPPLSPEAQRNTAATATFLILLGAALVLSPVGI